MACLRFRRSVLLLACACAAAGIWGCGPPVTEVSGTIKINGKPPNLKGLEISFLGADGRPASAPINPDGTYTATNVPAGDVQVCFVYMPEGAKISGGKRQLGKPGQDDTPPMSRNLDESKNPVPAALRDTATSKISAKLLAGQKNVFDYDMKP